MVWSRKSKLSSFFLFLLLILFIHSPNTFSAEKDFLNFKIESVFNPNATSRDILVDSDGFIWITTDDGLFQFDGKKVVKHFSFSDGSLPSNLVNDIFLDSDDEIWAIMNGYGIWRYNKSTGNAIIYSEKTGLSSNDFSGQVLSRIAEDPDGFIWVATQNGLNRFDKKTEKFQIFKNVPGDKSSISGNKAQVVISGKDKFVWVLTENGLNKFDTDKEVFVSYGTKADTFSLPKRFYHMVEDNKDNIWISPFYPFNGLIKFNKKNQTFKLCNNNSQGDEVLGKDDYLSGLLLYKEKFILGGVYNKNQRKIFAIDTDTDTFVFQKTGKENEVINGGVKSMAKDHSGNIWFLSLPGIVGIKSDLFNNFNLAQKDKGLTGNVVLSVVEDDNGTLWISCEGGVIAFDPKTETYRNFKGIENTVLNSFQSSLFIDENYLWFGSFSAFSKVDRKTLNVIKVFKHEDDDPDSLPSTEQIDDIIQDKNNQDLLWLSTIESGLFKFNKKTEKFSSYNDPYFGRLYSIIDDGKGYLWCASLGEGLYRFNKKTSQVKLLKHDNGKNSIISNDVHDLALDESENLWIATAKGLSKLNISSGVITNFQEKQGLQVKVIRNIEIGDNGYLWLASVDGVARFNPDDGSYLGINKEDGLHGGSNYSLQSFTRTSNGTIWFGGLNGLNHFHPKNLKSNYYNAPIYFTSLSQGGEKLQFLQSTERVKEITLDWQSNYFEFEAAALNYVKNESNQYKWRLEGWDKDWFISGTPRTGRYSGLTDGKYVLKVKASNGNGIWNENEANLGIVVLSPPWKTWWAYSSYIFAILIIIFVYERYNRKKVEQEEKNADELRRANEILNLEIRKKETVEEKLKISERRMIAIFNDSPDPIVVYNNNGYPEYLNQAFTDCFGWHQKELKDKRIPFVPEDQKEITKIKIEELYQFGKPVRFETKRLSKRGDIIAVLLSAAIIKGIKSINNNLVVNLKDITGRKKLEAQIQQSQKLESIGTLAGGIAHDFNNILFPIVGHSEMLLLDVPEDSPFKDGLNQIYTGAMRASELVKQILTFSRKENRELKLMKMQPIIKEALKLIRSTIPTTIKIKQNLNPKCGVIKADPTQIHQIVMNLSTNAYHAMEENGGEIKVNLKEVKLEESDLFNPDIQPGTYACLSIADTGKGIDNELIEKIFDPFFTTKEKGKGTGMGLSVVHGIIKYLHGTITVYSEPGKGTEFHVYLPLAETVKEQQVTNTTTVIQRGTEHILLVDDEKAIIEMEQNMLERLGYKVTSRSSSIEALEAFCAAPDKFDLVITDMQMPNMSGDKLSVELTKIRPGIPILLCTGFSEAMSEEKATSLGIKGFLLKPIIMKDLSHKIREVLDNNKIEIEN